MSVDANIDDLAADLFILYSSNPTDVDRRSGRLPTQHASGDVICAGSKLPIYCGLTTFDGPVGGMEFRRHALDYTCQVPSGVLRRVGYDLFAEVRHLLTVGQPASQACIPTLELHIDLLRRVLTESGISFVEIPPRPAGFDFICCLTHDVDFFGIRRHKLDRTLAGFIARASIGTLVDVVRGRRPLADAFRNWAAVLSLPFVFMGLRRDFWNPFDDYARAESGKPSTFFLVPFRNRPGTSPDGTVVATRRVAYQASEIREEAAKVAASGCELAVHGIDAWRSADAGQSELRELTRLTNCATAGVRMHWLYFSETAPETLEAAGFDYDSTCGFNDAVGYKAGTSQSFRPLGTRTLMELPLAIMDSALFYRTRMGLEKADAG
ncbi:MAG: hypothetical protein WBC51_09885, partial [Vicinamibacterales bacterium]